MVQPAPFLHFNFYYISSLQVNLFQGYEDNCSAVAEYTNQELNAALHWFASSNKNTWSSQLAWNDYAHNTIHSFLQDCYLVSHPVGTNHLAYQE